MHSFTSRVHMCKWHMNSKFRTSEFWSGNSKGRDCWTGLEANSWGHRLSESRMNLRLDNFGDSAEPPHLKNGQHNLHEPHCRLIVSFQNENIKDGRMNVWLECIMKLPMQNAIFQIILVKIPLSPVRPYYPSPMHFLHIQAIISNC